VLSLTFVPCSLLLNRTEMLATQATEFFIMMIFSLLPRSNCHTSRVCVLTFLIYFPYYLLYFGLSETVRSYEMKLELDCLLSKNLQLRVKGDALYCHVTSRCMTHPTSMFSLLAKRLPFSFIFWHFLNFFLVYHKLVRTERSTTVNLNTGLYFTEESD